MNVDPVDDCRFFYINEYYQTTSQSDWRTRIGSFRIDGCTSDTDRPSSAPTTSPIFTPTATPNTATPTATAAPVNPPTPSAKSKAIRFIITNTRNERHTMTKLTIEWPASNGSLLQVRRGTNQVIFDTITPQEASPLTIEGSDWSSTAIDLARTIGPGSSKSYTARFDGFISTLSEEYKITATFDDDDDGGAAGQDDALARHFDVSLILD